VCSAHDDDDSRVFHRACVSLAAAGYEVHLIATSKAAVPYLRSGVHVHPLPMVGRRERLLRRSRVASLAAGLKPDLFHVHEPELLGPTLRRAEGRPVLWDVHESYMDVLMQRDWIPRWLRPTVRRTWDRRERSMLLGCAGVVAATEPIAGRYRELHSRVCVVANYPRRPTDANPSRVPGDGPTCAFAGSLSPDRGLFEVIEALGILRSRGTLVRLALAGRPVADGFLRSLFDRARDRGVEGLVSYHGVLPKEEVARFHGAATLGVVTYLPTGNSIAGLPTKLLECMSLGLPVVFSDFPVYREVAGVTGAGIPVDPKDCVQIADAIEALVKNPGAAKAMGDRGSRAVRERFNWEAEWPKLLEMYRLVLDPDASSPGRSTSTRGDRAPLPS
jgi:glycosyltransferase involved in cell wall biosynthesis